MIIHYKDSHNQCFWIKDFSPTNKSVSKKLIVSAVCEGVHRQWTFPYQDYYNLTRTVLPIFLIEYTVPTYLRTNLKVDNIQGRVVIISDSHYIGNVRGSTVVLLSSTVQNVSAEKLFAFKSHIKGEMHAKNISEVKSPQNLELESLTDKIWNSVIQIMCNEHGEFDIIVDGTKPLTKSADTTKSEEKCKPQQPQQ